MAQIKFFFSNPENKNTTFVNIVQDFQLYTSKNFFETNSPDSIPKTPLIFQTQKTKLNTNPNLILGLNLAAENQLWSWSKHQREPSSSMVVVNEVATSTRKKNKKKRNPQTQQPTIQETL